MRDLYAFAEEHGVTRFIVGPVDQDGRWRARSLRTDEFAERTALSQAATLFAVDVANNFYVPALGSAWTSGLPDARIAPDPSTARVVPWEPAAATVICDDVDPDGGFDELAPRSVLRRVVERLATAGLSAEVAVELEFHVLREDRRSLRDKAYSGLDFVAEPGDYRPFEPFTSHVPLDAWVETLRTYGLPVTASGTEYGPAHFELNLRHCPPLAAADDAIMLKHALKELAAQRGMTASFMARIGDDRSASGGHLHVSLGDDVFFNGEYPGEPSAVMRHFIAGVLATMADFAALSLPYVNSFKRLRPHSGSPTTITWGRDNRTAALRVLVGSPTSTRVENRLAGADANPYLTVAATLAGGLYGIERKLEPPEASTGNLWDAPIGTPLSSSLEEAAEGLEKSDVAREAFGERFVELYVASRRAELEHARRMVADWERARYLENV